MTQKYLVVTCNYPARARGVTKLMRTSEALRRCPELVLQSGEDLTPYRRVSKQALAVLQRFGPAQQLGLDEVWVDLTAEVARRLAAGGSAAWCGHVLAPGQRLVQDSEHRPMDLRAASLPPPAGPVEPTPRADACGAGAMPAHSAAPAWEARLQMGSAVAAEARSALAVELGLRTSAGVAANKLLAKLVSGIHKPDQQTVLLPPNAAAFVAPLPVRALPGVGAKLEADLLAGGVQLVGAMRAVPKTELVRQHGARTADFLYLACWGKVSTRRCMCSMWIVGGA